MNKVNIDENEVNINHIVSNDISSNVIIHDIHDIISHFKYELNKLQYENDKLCKIIESKNKTINQLTSSLIYDDCIQIEKSNNISKIDHHKIDHHKIDYHKIDHHKIKIHLNSLLIKNGLFKNTKIINRYANLYNISNN